MRVFMVSLVQVSLMERLSVTSSGHRLIVVFDVHGVFAFCCCYCPVLVCSSVHCEYVHVSNFFAETKSKI